MRKSVVRSLGVVCVLAWTCPAFAKTETLTGKVIDLWCYSLNKANTERDHKGPDFQGSPRGAECASACVKWDGAPVGLVTADGKVYQFMGGLAADNNRQIMAHMGHTVTITGDVAQKDGMQIVTASMSDLKMAK